MCNTTRTVCVTVLCSILMTAATSAAAMSPRSAEELEDLRGRLIEYIDQVSELQAYLHAFNGYARLAGPARDLSGDFTALAEARLALETIDPGHLEHFANVLDGYPTWWEIPGDLVSVFEEAEAQRNGGDRSLPDNCAYPPKVACDGCPFPLGNSIISLIGISVVEFAALVAEGVHDVINRSLGYNIPNPVKIIAAVIHYALEGVLVGIQFIDERQDECETTWENELIFVDVDVSVSSRASAEQIQAMQAGVDRLRRDNRRRAIEANMRGLRTHGAIASFVLPASQDGYVEEVVSIIQETIDAERAAGNNVLRAEEFLAEGNARRAAGLYKYAYKAYRRAYRDAVRR